MKAITKHNWQEQEVRDLYELPFMDCMFQAHTVLKQNFKTNSIQACALLSIKTGACPEDCAYCPQSAHYHTSVTKEKLMEVDQIVEQAKKAQATGASRFCMGAAWRNIPQKELPKIQEIIKRVKELGLETCATLGMVDEKQARQLQECGLDYYNHNLDTSPEYYEKIITSRTYQQRLDTLTAVREAGINVCCGGIIGMGESRADRIKLLLQLANLPEHPKSVPINQLIPIPGTPLENQQKLDSFEFIRTIAIARILMPNSYVRLSAGREDMSQEMQAWCFFAGANSIFYGDTLLTADNQAESEDQQMLQRLGIIFEAHPLLNTEAVSI